MNAKQQYAEAYRVARLLKTVYATLDEALEFINMFKWIFSADMFFCAYKATIS